jgi:hypothetical protein
MGEAGPGTIAAVSGGAIIAIGAIALRAPGVRRRQGGWALEAVGTALLAAGWIASVATR